MHVTPRSCWVTLVGSLEDCGVFAGAKKKSLIFIGWQFKRVWFSCFGWVFAERHSNHTNPPSVGTDCSLHPFIAHQQGHVLVSPALEWDTHCEKAEWFPSRFSSEPPPAPIHPRPQWSPSCTGASDFVWEHPPPHPRASVRWENRQTKTGKAAATSAAALQNFWFCPPRCRHHLQSCRCSRRSTFDDLFTPSPVFRPAGFNLSQIF